jgi:phage shock protein C
MNKKLYRSSGDRKVAGVCGGIAGYFGIDATVVRLVWVFFTFFALSGLMAYIVCAIVIPEEPADSGEK